MLTDRTQCDKCYSEAPGGAGAEECHQSGLSRSEDTCLRQDRRKGVPVTRKAGLRGVARGGRLHCVSAPPSWRQTVVTWATAWPPRPNQQGQGSRDVSGHPRGFERMSPGLSFPVSSIPVLWVLLSPPGSGPRTCCSHTVPTVTVVRRDCVTTCSPKPTCA